MKINTDSCKAWLIGFESLLVLSIRYVFEDWLRQNANRDSLALLGDCKVAAGTHRSF